MNADGSGLRTVFEDKDGEVADPSWSPDGRMIAFDSLTRFDAQRITIVKADGVGEL